MFKAVSWLNLSEFKNSNPIITPQFVDRRLLLITPQKITALNPLVDEFLKYTYFQSTIIEEMLNTHFEMLSGSGFGACFETYMIERFQNVEKFNFAGSVITKKPLKYFTCTKNKGLLIYDVNRANNESLANLILKPKSQTFPYSDWIYISETEFIMIQSKTRSAIDPKKLNVNDEVFSNKFKSFCQEFMKIIGQSNFLF